MPGAGRRLRAGVTPRSREVFGAPPWGHYDPCARSSPDGRPARRRPARRPARLPVEGHWRRQEQDDGQANRSSAARSFDIAEGGAPRGVRMRLHPRRFPAQRKRMLLDAPRGAPPAPYSEAPAGRPAGGQDHASFSGGAKRRPEKRRTRSRHWRLVRPDMPGSPSSMTAAGSALSFSPREKAARRSRDGRGPAVQGERRRPVRTRRPHPLPGPSFPSGEGRRRFRSDGRARKLRPNPGRRR